jgi:hypothetical protein
MLRASHSQVVSYSGSTCSIGARRTSSGGGSLTRQLLPLLQPRQQKTKLRRKPTKRPSQVRLYSAEYYAAAKAKRRGLGLIRFIGELFELQMLTERIMHECIEKLLGNVENPEEGIESLCKLRQQSVVCLTRLKLRRPRCVLFAQKGADENQERQCAPIIEL